MLAIYIYIYIYRNTHLSKSSKEQDKRLNVITFTISKFGLCPEKSDVRVSTVYNIICLVLVRKRSSVILHTQYLDHLALVYCKYC